MQDVCVDVQMSASMCKMSVSMCKMSVSMCKMSMSMCEMLAIWFKASMIN